MTLVLALVLVVGWSRSLVFSDVFHFPCIVRQQVVYFGNDGIVWTGFPISGPFVPMWDYRSALTRTQKIESMAISRLNVRGLTSAGWRVWRFAYSSIVIPLTLISAYLLLSTPRKSTPKKISKPIPNE